MKRIILCIFVLSCVMGSFSLNAVAETEESAKMISNWKRVLVGEPFTNNDAILKNIVLDKEKDLQDNVLSNLNKENESPSLFKNLPDWKQNSAQITETVKNIEKMAVLYQTPNSIYYQKDTLQKDIMYAMEYFYDQMYNEKIKNTYGNWWDWEIGTPQSYNNILVLMFNDLTEVELSKYIMAVDRFVPDPTKRLNGIKETGANLLDKSFIVMVRGILNNNSNKIQLGIDATNDVYKIVQNGDGFYKDGSFIQHTYNPYTGGYGEVLLARSADIHELFSGTDRLTNVQGIKKLYTYIETTYLPVMKQGEVFDMTRGRGMSRQNSSSSIVGRNILYEILVISSQNQDLSYRGKYARYVKEAIFQHNNSESYYNGLSIHKTQTFQRLMSDSSIKPDFGVRDTNNMLSAMNQMTHQKKDFAAGLSLFGKQISSFEYGNGENMKGFYMGTGMLYFYNNDLGQYDNDYWATIDMTRLPGTTTDHKLGNLIDWKNYNNPKSWSGGVSDGQIGSASMYYTMQNVTGSSLEAKKSWFFLKDKIVAMAAGINSKENADTETIVENRRLEKDGSNLLEVENTEVVLDQGILFKGASWAHLKGKNNQSDIGYVFPQSENIYAEKKARSGNWSDINKGGSSDQVSNMFATLSIPHGKSPSGGEYVYVILPGKNQEETSTYAKEMDVSILSNTPTQQVIYDDADDIWMGNFYEIGKVNEVEAKTRGAILINYKDNGVKVVMADPMKEQVKVIFTIPKKIGYKVAEKDDEITVKEDANSWIIEMDSSDKSGKSSQVYFE
ncbi:polysaccharide lyase 8 family protein [Bacillus tropicus]|uniref:polysaccharide lyase 8 family protein n=1 Tax=Bacillus tropicus TaxID=2026188 RepID=UPI0020043CC6|nr:polysaccharide lyase 8 family protein [Bacillus tropicus]